MSRRSTTFGLPIPPDRARAACRGAVARLGWELEEGATELTGREDVAQLCCHSWPCEVRIDVSPAGAEGSRLRLSGHVAGVGPISSRRVREGLGAVERAIRGAAAEAG